MKTLREILRSFVLQCMTNPEERIEETDKAISEIKKLGVVGYACESRHCKDKIKYCMFDNKKCRPVLIIDMSKIQKGSE